MIEINEISPAEALDYLQTSAILIDVREKHEVAQIAFDMPNVLNIPYSTFDDNYLNLPKDKKLIIACHLGIRSLRVAQFLVVQGWNVETVYSLQGGISNWEYEKLPTKVPPRTFSFAKPTSTSCCGGSTSGSCC